MRKFVVLSKNFIVNSIIFTMIFSLSIFAFCGINLHTASVFVDNLYYSGNQKSNKITLMVNVYWGTEYIDGFLDIFEKYNIKTTFFVGGMWAEDNPDVLKKIFSRGHEIANHGFHHKDHDKLSYQKNCDEILGCHNVVKNILGIDMNLFAPPSGAYNKTTVEIAKQLGYKTIMWTEGRDTIDWRDKDSEIVFQRAVKNAKGGDFVLMHPSLHTKNALEKIITTLQGQGFEICSVTKNLME